MNRYGGVVSYKNNYYGAYKNLQDPKYKKLLAQPFQQAGFLEDVICIVCRKSAPRGAVTTKLSELLGKTDLDVHYPSSSRSFENIIVGCTAIAFIGIVSYFGWRTLKN